MAKGKKSFVLYTDLIEIVEELTDDEAGLLFKTILRYVNDLDPEIPKEIKLAFIPIKQDLKRDLKKYEEKVERLALARNQNPNNNKELRYSNNETENRQIIDNNQLEISSVNVNDNVNVNVNVNDINDKLINDKSRACDTQETSNYLKNQKIKEELDSKGLSYADYTQLHKLVKGIYTSKELGIAECVVLSDLLKKMDSKYDKKQVMQAWLYSWSKSKESLNRVAYIKSILEKNIKQVERIGLLN